MAQYKETINTKKALNLIAKMLAGTIEEIEFTKIRVSDKDYSLLSEEELQNLESIEEIKQETLVSEKVLLDDNTVNIHGIIYNTELQNSYYLRTIALYANDPDDGEILYSITPATHADYVPTPNGNNITTLIIDLKTIVSGAKVNLQGNPSALVDVSMLNKKLDKGEGLEENFNTAVKIVNELKKKQNETDNRLLTKAKKIWEAINELFNNKLEKGGYTGNAKNLNDEISKKASTTQLGRIIVGTGLSVDDNGRVSHSSGAGNNHVPSGGSVGQFLKNTGNGIGSWETLNLDDYYDKGEIDGKFKNFCPYRIGDIFITTNSTNPSSIYLGTTWQKLEDVVLKGTSSTHSTTKQIIGSDTISIQKANLPNIKLKTNSFSLSRGTMDITGQFPTSANADKGFLGAFSRASQFSGNGANPQLNYYITFTASKAWTGSTSEASPYTEALGSGQVLNITPKSYIVNMWIRLT